jgi:hypothetical protein
VAVLQAVTKVEDFPADGTMLLFPDPVNDPLSDRRYTVTFLLQPASPGHSAQTRHYAVQVSPYATP